MTGRPTGTGVLSATVTDRTATTATALPARISNNTTTAAPAAPAPRVTASSSPTRGQSGSWARAGKHAPVPGPAGIRRPALPGAGAGAWRPGTSWTTTGGCPAHQEGAVAAHPQVLPSPVRPDRQRAGGAVPRLRDVLRRAVGVQEQRAGRDREPRGVGQGPLPRPGRDVRRVGVLQPAAEGRQAVVLPRRAERRGAQLQAGEGQGQERVRARHPGHAEVPGRARRSRARASGASWRTSRASRRS